MFQSTRPTRGATSRHPNPASPVMFQSTRPTRGATYWRRAMRPAHACFNPRAPRGARLAPLVDSKCYQPFQSTRPTRGATEPQWIAPLVIVFQSTRPTRGATTWRADDNSHVCFNPRAPRGARRHRGRVQRPEHGVSIHAPHAGRDTTSPCKTRKSACFNPRAPRGARQRRPAPPTAASRFNPRAPRGARPDPHAVPA